MKKQELKGNVSAYKIGNYTKNAVENFEGNIVEQTNYLEKVDKDLDK
ncbi:hypothetical protein [Clostridium sp. Ade.TY]|nr:hypothetical protein [Clostridium sp. Ade.TY]